MCDFVNIRVAVDSHIAKGDVVDYYGLELLCTEDHHSSLQFEEDQQSRNFVKFTDFFISVNPTHSLIVGKSTENNIESFSPRN